MELFLPTEVIEQMEAAGLATTEVEANRLVRAMLDDIAAKRPKMIEVPTEDGARIMTATIFLFRSKELLIEILDTPAKMLQTLGLRSVFEFAAVGLYLLDHPDGPDEFRRRFHHDMKAEAAFAVAVGNIAAPAPDFLQHLVEPVQKRVRDLASMVRELDRLDGRSEDDRYAATHVWRMVHNFVSQSGSHANTVSTKRFTSVEGGVLGVRADPPPLIEQPPVLIVTLFVADLARSVYRAHQIPEDSLPTQICRPPPAGV